MATHFSRLMDAFLKSRSWKETVPIPSMTPSMRNNRGISPSTVTRTPSASWAKSCCPASVFSNNSRAAAMSSKLQNFVLIGVIAAPRTWLEMGCPLRLGETYLLPLLILTLALEVPSCAGKPWLVRRINFKTDLFKFSGLIVCPSSSA